MKTGPSFPVVYMFIVTAFFSTLLIGFSRLTRQRVESNAQLNFERAVLEAFPEIEVERTAQIHPIFTERFEKDPDLGVYRYRADGRLRGYAVPFSGQGFWDKIEGIIGIDVDGKTITGVAFYEQKETPGLGARIDEDAFRRQFVGKTLDDSDEPIGIVPAGEPLESNQVHAVTGATQTSVRLETLMNRDIRAWLDRMDNREEAP